MTSRVPEEKLQQLIQSIQQKPGSASSELFSSLQLGVSPRTFKNYLSRLVSEGRIRREGVGKATRYYPPKTKLAPLEEIQLSPEAIESRDLVLRIQTARHPVGYDIGFLAAYEPNKTEYLSKALCEELAKIGHISTHEQPAGTYLRQILDRLLIDLSFNSSRLEGNTYSLLDTQKLLEAGEAPSEKAYEETQMLLNHKAAVELLAEQADEIGFNRYTILNLHALLSDNLLPDASSCGKLRERPVRIGSSIFHPLEVPQLIESQFNEILTKADQILDPFEQAFFAMVHLPYLQPFEDVNKRVSRLAANIPFARKNLRPLSFIDVPRDHYLQATIAVYELNRIDYLRDLFVWAYRRSAQNYSAVRQSLGKPDPFRLRYRKELTLLIRETVLGEIPAQPTLESLSEDDREKMKQVLTVELQALHEGNISRHRLRPAEFLAWKSKSTS